MKYTRFIIVLCLIVFLGNGCVQIDVDTTSEAPTTDTSSNQPQTRSIGESAKREVVHFGPETYDRMILYKFDKEDFTWRFDYKTSPQPISQWAGENPKAAVVINGTYFHEDERPSGLLIVNEERIGNRSFDYKKSGMIVLQPEVKIVDTSNDAVDPETLLFAGQSYPFLIKDDQIAIDEDSGYTARRSFFGTDTDGHVYIGVVPSARISLYELSHILSNTSVEWRHVINLDGGASTGIDVRLPEWTETIDSLTSVPSVLIAEPKTQK